MRTCERPDIDRILEQCWPSRLVVTDHPSSWSTLVAEIAELEELLAEVDAVDGGAVDVIVRLRALLDDRRQSLRAIDVG
ncbi:MAG: hypothetical protein H6977_05540 [Gammaproteobacteria bacterium]|nr:hypothetical protein [Gammaproteobacteria bacterium]